jgi:paraquat-inducible protein A
MTAFTAVRAGLLLCPSCGILNRRASAPRAEGHPACAGCGSTMRARKPRSLSRTLALLLAACILYAPANLLPILETSSEFGSQRDTIMSGVVYLWASGSWPLAVLIFTVSICIPLAKLLALGFLLFSVHRRWSVARLQRARLYRIVEKVGRWSMTDVFVAAIVSTLVQLQGLATVKAGPGVVAFGAVVVLTLLATHTFDPRLIWDPDRGAA